MQIEIILPSIILGIMLFFSFAVAPIIFKVLKENDARKFVRTIFPYYYCINLIFVSLVCIFLFYKDFINFQVELSKYFFVITFGNCKLFKLIFNTCEKEKKVTKITFI